MTRHSYAGRVASNGVVSGTLRRDRPARFAPARAATTVVGAIASTLQQLQALQSSTGDLGSEILQFQVEMLEDDLFVTEILERAAAGNCNKAAIHDVINDQVAAFMESDSETFVARAADLADLRDRLLGAFGSTAAEAPVWPEDTILLVDDMTPSRFLEMDWNRVRGLVAQSGSSASHVALLARAQSVPMLVGVGEIDPSMLESPALLDAVSGRLVVNPEPAEADRALADLNGPAISEDEGKGLAIAPDGTQIRVNLSVNSLATLEETPRDWFDGIGLVRTELLLPDPDDLLREDVQADIYRRLFDWAGDAPVSIRLFDAGGDKVMPGFSLPDENNAFLGVRGARLLARRPDVLRTQYSAILRAAAGKPVRILVPMLTLPKEMPFFRQSLQEVMDEQGVDPASVMLGMMVETPAAALEVDKFGADFFALGTNDLIQYTLAASRDNDALDFGEEIAPAVLDLIEMVVMEAEARGTEATLCGDAAASRTQLKQIIECGIRSVSIPGRFAPRFKHFIRSGE